MHRSQRLLCTILSLLLTLTGCAQIATSTTGTAPDGGAFTIETVDGFSSDSQPLIVFGRRDASVDRNASTDAGTDASVDAGASEDVVGQSDTSPSDAPRPEALRIDYDGPERRSFFRGSRGISTFEFRLLATRSTIDLDAIPFSIDQFRASACAIGADGQPNYLRIEIRDRDTRELLYGPTELSDGPRVARVSGVLRRAFGAVTRLRQGIARSYEIALDLRMSDPGCPFLGEGFQVTVGDVRTGTFFTQNTAVDLDAGRSLFPDEITGNHIIPGSVMTVTGPAYGTRIASNTRGDFWTCQPFGDGMTSVYLDTSCCTNGIWYSLADVGGRIHGGMLLRSFETGRIYYTFGREDGTLARVHAPTMSVLNSWYDASGVEHRGIDDQDPEVCLNVTGVTDAELASLPLVANITYRPGSTYFRVAGRPEIYTVGVNRTLYTLQFRGRTDAEIPGTWLPSPLVQTIPAELLIRSDYRSSDVLLVDERVSAEDVLRDLAVARKQIETPLR